MIKEYWNLIGREPYLSLTWELDFSQACSFCRMLMNHKNFHFTQIPDKNNDMIFLKSPKTMLLGHFCQIGIFSKNPAVPHNYIQPLTAPEIKFQKKLTSQSQENRTLQPRPRIQQPLFSKWPVGIHQILF